MGRHGLDLDVRMDPKRKLKLLDVALVKVLFLQDEKNPAVLNLQLHSPLMKIKC